MTLAQRICGLRGHDAVLHIEGRRLLMRCTSCEHDSPGWFIGQEEGQMVRAKVYCDSLEGNEVKFSTVYEPDAAKDTENARFTKATPFGEIRLGIDNPAAIEQFQPGKTYYVDFTPVTE